MNVRILKRAEADLQRITDRVAIDNPAAARTAHPAHPRALF
jgi:plasmid stabilization system protein ParE